MTGRPDAGAGAAVDRRLPLLREPAAPAGGPAAPAPADPGPLVRPYALTGGRTRSKGEDLPFETLLVATPAARAAGPGLAPEARRILALCTRPQSVAEVSAHLSVPLGVARVLVGDLADDGLIAVHRPVSSVAGPRDLRLLERVLHGLRSL